VNQILIQLSHLQKAGKSVTFCWVPCHTGLPGNEAADAADNVAVLHGKLVADRALGTDFRIFLYRAVLSSWQDELANTQGNNL
jgi:hypothetical protein